MTKKVLISWEELRGLVLFDSHKYANFSTDNVDAFRRSIKALKCAKEWFDEQESID